MNIHRIICARYEMAKQEGITLKDIPTDAIKQLTENAWGCIWSMYTEYSNKGKAKHRQWMKERRY